MSTFDSAEGTNARESESEKMLFSFAFRSLKRTFDFVEGTDARESESEKMLFSFAFRSLKRTFLITDVIFPAKLMIFFDYR